MIALYEEILRKKKFYKRGRQSTYFVKFSFMSLEKSQLITAEQSVSCMRTSLSTNTTIICPHKAQA